MEAAIQTVVKVFLKSSKGKERLGKKEFQTLVKSELSNILTDTDSKDAINKMGQDLDADKDGKLGFEEYMKLVGYLAVSLSEQRELAQEEPAQNACCPADKEEEKTEANAEAKPEAKQEAAAAAAAPAEVKVEVKADGMLEVKAEGEAQPQVAKEEPVVAAVEVVVTEEKKVENTEKEEEAEKEEAQPESKTEEATS